jgi:hypothetical protein
MSKDEPIPERKPLQITMPGLEYHPLLTDIEPSE